MDKNINAFINAAIRTAAEKPEPQAEPERKPVRLIDANAIKYTTRTIEHSQDGAPPVTFAYKEDIDKLPTVDPESLEIVNQYKTRLDSAIKEREAAKRVIKDFVMMFGIKITDPTQAFKSISSQTDDDVVEALIRARF